MTKERLHSHREQFIYKFGSQFYDQTSIVEQCTLQIYMKQIMINLSQIIV